MDESEATALPWILCKLWSCPFHSFHSCENNVSQPWPLHILTHWLSFPIMLRERVLFSCDLITWITPDRHSCLTGEFRLPAAASGLRLKLLCLYFSVSSPMCFMTDYSFSQFILNTENMCRSVVKRQSLKQIDQDVRLNFKLIVLCMGFFFSTLHHRQTIRTVRGIVMSRATCDPFVTPALGLIQVIGRNAS